MPLLVFSLFRRRRQMQLIPDAPDAEGRWWRTRRVRPLRLRNRSSTWLDSTGLTRLGSARIDWIRLGSTWLGSDRLDSAWFGWIRLGSTRPGSDRLDSARLGWTWLGSTRLGWTRHGSARLGSDQLDSARIVSDRGTLKCVISNF
jgi:hypothetical protein